MAERHVEWTDAARDDLRAIAWHIAQDSLDNALAVADRIDQRAAALAMLSTRGRIVPELRRMAETRYREVIEEPWRIIYRVDGSMVHIAAVVDGRRDVRAWLRERMARFKVTAR